MNLDGAKSCWHSQEQLPGIAMSDSQVLEMVRERSRAFDARTRKRDWREILAMVAAALLALPTLLRPSSWLARAGAVVLLTGCALICWKLMRARRGHPVSEETLGAQSVTGMLRSQRAKVDAQIDLLQSVLWW